MNLTETMLNLDIMAMVQVHDKVVSDGARVIIQPNGAARSMLRWWYADGRQKSYETVRTVFNNSLNLVELLILRNETGTARRVATAVQCAMRGVHALGQTYLDDHEIHAKFSRLALDIEHRLAELHMERRDERAPALPSPRSDTGEDSPPVASSSPAHIPCKGIRLATEGGEAYPSPRRTLG